MSSLRDVQRLKTLTLVLDLGSISAAASVLGYTQSATSQQLRALEREVGMPLVDRSQRPLRATPTGALLRQHVEHVLAAVESTEALLRDMRAGVLRLRVAAFGSSLSSFVPVAVRDLRRDHPQLVVHVQQLETDEAVRRLRSGDADLAVVHHMPGAPVPETTGLVRHPLLVDRLHVLVPEGHRLARHDTISIADLEGEPLILPRTGTPAARFRTVLEHLCAQAGFSPQAAYELDDPSSAQAFVATGIAVVPMHGLMLASLPPGATSRPLTERDAGSRIVEALAPAAPRRAAVDDLLEKLTRAARAYSVA